MKLELGAGPRPTRGYLHNDLHAWPHIEHVGPAWMIDLPDSSLDEVLALAFIEHLTYYEALDTFRNVHRMLKPGGLFLFDVPDYPAWASYYLQHYNPTYAEEFGDGPDIPSIDDCRRTLFGWGRFPGDEHKYGWDQAQLESVLQECGFAVPFTDVIPFKTRAHRDRFSDPANAHLYMMPYKK